jgi:hypothetical protein
MSDFTLGVFCGIGLSMVAFSIGALIFAAADWSARIRAGKFEP